jgi:hypothetical protein
MTRTEGAGKGLLIRFGPQQRESSAELSRLAAQKHRKGR